MTSVRWIVAVLLVSAMLSAAMPGAVPARAEEPVRILIVGDSVAQGSAGDYTWRYRLWQALDDADVEVDLVGPRRDVYDNVAGELGSTAYDPAVAPDFDRDHAAVWATLLGDPAGATLPELVEDYDADVVIETRGLNDLLHWASGSAVSDLVRAEIAAVRDEHPDVDFVVAQLPQTWLDNPGRWTAGTVADYNDELVSGLDALDDPSSEVAIARTGTGLVESVDTWDPAHLSATGELKMASGILDALAELGVGPGAPTSWPQVTNGHWGGADLDAVPLERAARLSWIRPPGARSEVVWLRDTTVGEEWRRLPVPLEGTSWEAHGLVAGHRYEFRLQAVKGVIEADAFSDVVPVVPTAPAEPPAPTPGIAAPGAPTGLVVVPGHRSLRVSWDAGAAGTTYDVVVVGATTGFWGRRTVDLPAATFRGLLAGEGYTVVVTPLNAVGAGPDARATGTPSGPTVPGPAGLHGQVRADGRIALSWRPRAAATAYTVAGRREGRWVTVRTTTAPRAVLRIGAEVTRFRVRSWYDRVAGGWSAVVRLRR